MHVNVVNIYRCKFIINVVIFVCHWLAWGCRQRGGLSAQSGVGAVVRRTIRAATLTAQYGYAKEIPKCTQNAASTSCDKPLDVKKIKDQLTKTPEVLAARLKRSRRLRFCRRNHYTTALADAL